jgi:hypothetical protein
VTFLSKAERDYLLQIRELTKTQQRYIRYKLHRKIKQFYGIELPLLIDKGYIVAANDCGVAASSHVQERGLAWLGYRLTVVVIMRRKVKEGGPSRIRTNDPRHVKAVS